MANHHILPRFFQELGSQAPMTSRTFGFAAEEHYSSLVHLAIKGSGDFALGQTPHISGRVGRPVCGACPISREFAWLRRQERLGPIRHPGELANEVRDVRFLGESRQLGGAFQPDIY